jgi:hypothetical protein
MVGAISSFVLARNRYANGYLAMPLGAFNFACQSHVDVKRTLSRFGLIVGDTTTRANLKSMTDSSIRLLKDNVAEARKRVRLHAALYSTMCNNIVLSTKKGLEKRTNSKLGLQQLLCISKIVRLVPSRPRIILIDRQTGAERDDYQQSVW